MTPLIANPDLVLGEIDVSPAKEDERYHSVTTIIGALDKPALIYWAAKETATAAVNMASYLDKRVATEGPEAVIRELSDARFRAPKGQLSASALGTAVHDACERYALSGVRPIDVDPEVLPFLDRFDEWAQIWQPEYLMAEAAVYNRTFGYAGTLDAIVKIDGQVLILDYKSSRKSTDAQGKPSKPYPEVALQLAAYRNAELVATWRARRFEKQRRRYYLLNGEEVELGHSMADQKVEGAVALHLTPEHADLYPIDTGEDVYRAFLFAIEIFRWSNDLSKKVIGEAFRSRVAS